MSADLISISQNKFIRVVLEKKAILTCFLLLVAFLYASFRSHEDFRYIWQIDGISYINIAHDYSEFDFRQAVNGYWSPLISWLLAPFLWFIEDGIEAMHYLNYFIGGGVLVLVFAIFLRLRIPFLLSLLLAALSFPFIRLLAVSYITPDLLSVLCCSYFIYLLLGIGCGCQPKYWHLGTTAAMCYFSKYYNFYFMGFIFLSLIVYYLIAKKKEQVAYYLKSYGVMLGICFIWMFFIYLKYDRVTVSTSSAYNRYVYGPGVVDPIFTTGPVAVDKMGIQNPWVDPSFYKTEKWSVFASDENYEHQKKIFQENYKKYKEYFSPNQWARVMLVDGILIILVLIFAAKELVQPSFLVLLAFFLIYPLPYFAIVLNDRYVWINFFILYFLFAWLTGILWVKMKSLKIFSGKARYGAYILLAGILFFTFGAGFSKSRESKKLLIEKGKWDYVRVEALKKEIDLEGKKFTTTANEYYTALFTAYQTDSYYMGIMPVFGLKEDFHSYLDTLDADYLILFPNTNNFDLDFPVTIVTIGTDSTFVYRLK